MVRTALLSQNAQPVRAMRAMPNVASPITPKLMTSSSDSRSPSTTRRMIVTPTSELIACSDGDHQDQDRREHGGRSRRVEVGERDRARTDVLGGRIESRVVLRRPALVALLGADLVDGVADGADPDRLAVGHQCSVPPVKVQPSMRTAGTTTPPRNPLSVLRSRATATVPARAAR